jgi:hypothetical protein
MASTGKSIAAIACSNGLGHSRRIIAISSFLYKNGFNGRIDLYISEDARNAFKNWSEYEYLMKINSVNFIDFLYPNSQSEKFDNLSAKDWNKIAIPKLSSYDLVWSDNILQILTVRPDTVLTGSFLWHEVFQRKENNCPEIEKFILDQKNILDKYKPQMAGNEYFVTDEVKKRTKFVPVGLYRYNFNLRKKTKRGILLSCGLGGEELEITKKAVNSIIENNITPPDYLYVEKRILPEKYPSWIKPADFSDEMFHDCVAACIRPGLGTVSDALINHLRLFAFSEPNSFEMYHNGKVIVEMGLGQYTKDPFTSYKNAVKYANNDESINLQQFKTVHLRTDGIFATTKFLLNNL